MVLAEKLSSADDGASRRVQVMHFTREILTIGQPTRTGRIYPREVVQDMVSNFNTDMLCGMGIPDIHPNIDTNFDDASHMIDRLYIRDNKLYAEIGVLDTPMGKLMVETLQSRVEVTFHLCGVGVIDEETNRLVSYTLHQIYAEYQGTP